MLGGSGSGGVGGRRNPSGGKVKFTPLHHEDDDVDVEDDDGNNNNDHNGLDNALDGGESNDDYDYDSDMTPKAGSRTVKGRRIIEPLEIEDTTDDNVRLVRVDDDAVIVDPHAQGMGGDLVSAVFGIVKAMVGPAILYLPHGFAQAGYMFAVPILLLSTVLYLSSSRCLLDCWKLERSRRSLNASGTSISSGPSSSSSLSYPDLALGAFGSRGEAIVKIGIAAMQSGVCLTYLIFVPQNLKASVLILTGKDVPMSHFLLLMVLVEIPLSWIKNVRHFTLTNVLANFLILYGLLTCLGFAAGNAIVPSNDNVDDIAVGPIHSIIEKLSDLRPFASGWYLFIGTSVLLFEGSITLLVPLQEAVDLEEDKKRFPSLYWKVILAIICFYSFFGVFCWLSFGDEVSTAMTTSLPETTMATTVQLAYSVAVIFTFPLQNYPSLEITVETIQSSYRRISLPGVSWILRSRNLIASILVCLLALVASVTLDSLDKVVSLMGSLLGCPLAFVFPPLIHNRLDPDLSSRRRTQNIIVAALGLVAMIFASLTTIAAW